jgi:signal transduction histidine kinase
MSDNPTSLLQAALERNANARSPVEAATALLEVCLAHTSSESGRVYLLKPGSVDLEPFASIPDGASQHGRTVDAAMAEIPDRLIGSLESFLGFATRSRETPRSAVGTVVYAIRSNSCVGALRLDDLEHESLPSELRLALVAVARLLVPIYEDRFAFDLLGELQDPLDFTQSSDEFYKDIARLIARSSSMRFTALREVDGDRLRCIAVSGFEELGRENEDWDLYPVDAYPAFQRALDGHTVQVPDAHDQTNPLVGAISEQPWSRMIGSFVAVPIQVGTEIIGVLSVAAPARFDYSPLELRGFESIANGVGVSIKNFRSSRELATQITNQAETAVAITGIEVARVARHEAVGWVDNASIRVHRIRQELPRTTANASSHFNRLEDDLRNLSGAIEKIRLVTRVPKDEWSVVPVGQLWNEARNAVAGRLESDKITDHWQGPNNLQVWAIRDRLRHVFLNLLLNSIEAFQESRARGRRIDVTVERPASRANNMTITYRDNASGINPARLYVPDEYSDDPVTQQVFGAAVTSKDEGSGYGLWLARKVVTEHGGSIDLLDYRNGVTFVIRLPKPDSWTPRKEKK